MEQENIHQSVIILLKGSGADNRFIKRWFKKSRYLTEETNDIFQAFEEISDFTVCRRPDVILLEVGSPAEDFFVIREMAQTLFAHSRLPIFALSDSGKIVNHKDCFEGNLAQLEARLENIFPQLIAARVAA